MTDHSTIDFDSLKYRIHNGQKVLGIVLLLSFLSLSFSIAFENRSSRAEVNNLKSVDNQLIAKANAVRSEDLRTLSLLILFMVISLFWWFWMARTSVNRFRANREILINESTRLKDLAQELATTNMMIFELETLNESKNEFISNISHELRTPLTSIIGYTDLLATSPDFESNPQTAEIFNVLDRNATILSTLVQSLLELSRLDSPHERNLNKNVDLLRIIEDAIFILQPEISKKNLHITFTYDNFKAYSVLGESGLFSQAIINLLSNAIKFSRAAQEIQMTLERKAISEFEDSISLSIRDFGIGIPQGEIPKISERFYRASNARFEHTPGSGLGLAIVAKVIEIHNGKFLIESTLGVGTNITLVFPAPISPVDKLIAGRKYKLLEEAISALSTNDVQMLMEKLHEFGGVLGFYDFPELGRELIELYQSIITNSGRDRESTLAARNSLLAKMRSALPQLEKDPSHVE